MKQAISEERWKYSRQLVNLFLLWYKKQNKKTQDKIQEIINYYDITYSELNKRIKPSDKERLKRKIEEWKHLGIYKGYFKYHIEELMENSINYRELIEILLYGAFMEELQGIDTEINNLFQNVSQDCYNQGRNDLGKSEKEISHSFLDDFSLVLIDGIVFTDYLDALYLTNMQEIQKQYLIALQQNKKLAVYSDTLQRQFDKQRNRLISVNDDKYSGGLDKYVTALGNMAYLEASSGYNAEVKFISDHCEHVTEMCSYMDGMIFNTEKRNVFKRPYGDTQKDLVLQEMDIMGLVIGINMPPIVGHMHWCHSCLSYQTNKSSDEIRENMKETKLNNVVISVCDKLYEEFEKDKKERLALIDINKMQKVADISIGTNSNVNYSDEQAKYFEKAPIDSIITIHTHDNDKIPSWGDIKKTNEERKIYKSVIVSENYIYEIKPNKRYNMTKNFEDAFDVKRGDLYDKYEKDNLSNALKETLKGIEWEYERRNR